MIPDFDPTRAGKAVHDLSPVAGRLDGVEGDVICCINNGEGASVLLVGGIHGDEYEAQIVLRRLMERLKPEDVTGRVIIIPSLNYPAAQQGRRVSAFDGQNMNRCFPGNADGTPTERLCAFVNDRLFPVVDLLIDVHAGGDAYIVAPMVFGFATEKSAVNEARLNELMEAWGYRFVQHVDGIAETACGAARIADLASIEVEGGGGRTQGAEIEIMEQGLLRALAAFGAIRPQLAAVPFDGVHFEDRPAGRYHAEAPGLVEHVAGLGEQVSQGQLVARLHPTGGASSVAQEVLAPVAGIVVRQANKAFLKKGDLVGNIGAIIS